MRTERQRAPQTWKVGELARQTGLTERTLRYYDRIGLLRPSQHSAAGYRLYTPGDIARLQRILALRQLGMPLDEVKKWLDSPNHAPLEAIELQLRRLRQQIELQRLLAERLEALATWLRTAEQPPAQLVLEIIEAMMNIDYGKHYTPEQLEELRQRREQLGSERIRTVEAEWPQLIAEMRAAMEAGADPASEPVQALARRWQALVDEFTGGNPAIEQVVGAMYAQEPAMRQMSGIDDGLFAYVGRAMQAGKQK